MIKFAILGAGNIAHKMAATVSQMEQSVVTLYAVAAREKQRAQQFAAQYGIEKAYEGYEAMLQDPEVQLVYIATPHTLHFRHMKLCLEAGKHVLCEKPFTVHAEETREIQALAKQKGLLCTEAIWTRYMPSRTMIDEIIRRGDLGEVTSLTANLGYDLREFPRIWDTRLAGGALLDVGVYLVHFARMIFGTQVEQVLSTASFTKQGVDVADSITLTFPEGKQAVMHCNVKAALSRNASIFGTNGYLEIDNINNPQMIRVFNTEYTCIQEYPVPKQISGYEYEVLSCVKAITEGKLVCPEISHEETLAVMEIMDTMRKQWGYEIPRVY